MSVRLSYKSQGAAGPPVLILHGLLGSSSNWRSIARRLAQRHRVFALDMPNHGESPHVDTMSYPAMAGDVLERLRAEPSVVPLAPRRWWAAGLVAAAALIALVLSPVFRGGPTGFETVSEVAWFVPELDSLETAELLLVLNTFDGAAGVDEVIGLPLEDDLETVELEQVLQAWEG